MNLKILIKFLFLLLVVVLSGCSTTPEQPKVFQKIDDIRQARIGVMLGSNHDVLVTKEMTEAEIIRIETEPDLFLALQQGKCDVIFADFTNFLIAQSQYPEMVEVPSDFPADFYGVGFHKENRALQAQFNAFLKEIRESGLYQEIYDRWIFHGTESEMPVIEIPTNGEPLNVAVPGSLYPFSFMKNQNLAGFDVELMLRFAQKMQRPVDFQMIGFGSLIASLQSGKSDIISAGMCITEERQKMVLFSDPYFETRIVVATIPHGASRAVDDRSFWQSLKDSFTSNLLVEKRYLLILEGLQTTVVISIFSILLGTLLGALVCFMRMHKSLWCRIVASSYISLMRGMPVLVLLMLMFYVFLAELPVDGVQVAIITFALNFSAYVSEMFRTAIEGVDRGQTEAGIALGFTPAQTFYHIVMPQAIKNVMPVYKGEMISLIKMTSIVGYIAVEDLTKMSDIIRSRTFDAFFPLIMVAILYFILAWIFGKALDMLNPKHQPES